MKLINRTFKPLVTRHIQAQKIRSASGLDSFIYSTSSLQGVSINWSSKMHEVPANPWMKPGGSKEFLSCDTGYLLLEKFNAGMVKFLCANDLRLPFQVRRISFTRCSQLYGYKRNCSQSTLNKAVSTDKSV